MAYHNFCLMDNNKHNLVTKAEKILDDLGIPSFKSRKVDGTMVKSIVRKMVKASLTKNNIENRGSGVLSIKPMANCTNIAERYKIMEKLK